MAQTIYLSDREEELILTALQTQGVIESDRGDEGLAREYFQLDQKIRKG